MSSSSQHTIPSEPVHSSRQPLKNPFQIKSKSDTKDGKVITSLVDSDSPTLNPMPPTTRTYCTVEDFMGTSSCPPTSSEAAGACEGVSWQGVAEALKNGQFKKAIEMAGSGMEGSSGEERSLWGAVEAYGLMMLGEWSKAGDVLDGVKDSMKNEGDVSEDRLSAEGYGKFWILLYSAILPCCSGSVGSRPSMESLRISLGLLRSIDPLTISQEKILLKSEALVAAELSDLYEVQRIYTKCLLPKAEGESERESLQEEQVNLLLRIGALPEAEDVLMEMRPGERAESVKASLAIAEENYPAALASLTESTPHPNTEACLHFYLGSIASATTMMEQLVRDQSADIDTLTNLYVLYNFKSATEASTAKKTLLSVVSSTSLNDKFTFTQLEGL
ncbi:hypothetical protein FOL47_007295 [Perkinsus chesapeaki]|uniref:Uncharacterized protein n=1 Tax=Perkinsus chesapeaki TaxID=330153 RepID=A0A7J6LLB9_PERCH|nr:hypothetical protein FOL47_007295 [Perkinsus chesapeaki]